MNRHSRKLIGFFTAVWIAAHAGAAEPLANVLRAEDRSALGKAEADFKQSVMGHADSTTPASDKKAAAEVLALLNMAREKAPTPQELVGKWRVRSIQADKIGVFAYPYFSCEFRKEGASKVIFQKDTGSQRRIGLVGEEDEDKLLFLGSSYYTDEKAGSYSALQDQKVKTQADPARDSVGYLYQIGKGHLLLVFATNSYGAEVYELKKGR